MAGDVLYDPLGQDPAPRPRRPGRMATVVAVGIIIACVIGGVSTFRSYRAVDTGGVIAQITPVKPVPPPSMPAPPAAASVATPSGDGVEVQNGVKVIRPPGPAPAGPMIIKVPQEISVALQPAPDQRLIEKTHFGLLPRRGPDGARPADVYARPVVTDTALKPNAPRIALVVGGMGLNAPLTSSAVAMLPAAVTLAFAPYGDDLERQVQSARDVGHEVMLQVPMEGFGDPASSAMSHLLATGLDGKDLLDRLHWHMGRFTGYVAVATFLGARFTADDAGLAPVLRDVAARGLFYFDDGSSPRSLASRLAATSALPLARADVIVDASVDGSAVDAALVKLEAVAREHGTAVGFASGLPAGLSRVAAFAQDLASRGIALVPVSSLAVVPPTQSVVQAKP